MLTTSIIVVVVVIATIGASIAIYQDVTEDSAFSNNEGFFPKKCPRWFAVTVFTVLWIPFVILSFSHLLMKKAMEQ